jgi:hypothetical protein
LRFISEKQAQIVLYLGKNARIVPRKNREFMKKNLRAYFGVLHLGVGAALLAPFAFTSVSRADVDIVNSLGDTRVADAPASGNPFKVEDFSTTVSGQISGVILDLNFNGVAVTAGSPLDVYVYGANGSGPTGSGFLLGTITPTTTGDHQYTVSGLQAYSLTAGQDYAIGIDETLGTGTVGWEYAAFNSPNSGIGGSFLGALNSTAGSAPWVNSNPLQQRFMDVTVVPEPMTGAFLGFGVLALVATHRLRRKTF